VFQDLGIRASSRLSIQVRAAETCRSLRNIHYLAKRPVLQNPTSLEDFPSGNARSDVSGGPAILLPRAPILKIFAHFEQGIYAEPELKISPFKSPASAKL
jgi:hypothetical protein